MTPAAARSIRAALGASLLACAWAAAAGEPASAGGEDAAADPGIALSFEGLRSIRESAIRAAIEPWLEDFDPELVEASAAEDLAWLVAEYCRGEGYIDAKVEGTVEKRDGEVVVTLRIEEGERFFVRGIRISGNRRVSDAVVRQCFAWKRTGFFGAGSAVYSRKALEEGIDGVRAYYRSEGFRDVLVAADPPAIDRDAGRVDLSIRIEEGRQYILRELRIEGVEAPRAEKIRTALGATPPVPLGTDLVSSLAGRTRDLLREEGHLFAEVHPDLSIDDATAEARLALAIREGPLARIERIAIQGLEKVRESVARQILRFREGDVARQDLIDEAHRRLLQRGLFRGARIDVEKLDPEGERIAVKIDLEEAPRYEFQALAGLGSYEILRGGASAENKNLWGLGHRIRVGGKISLVDERVEAEYGVPWILGSSISQRSRVYYLDRREPSFRRQDAVAEILFDTPLLPALTAESGYSIRSSRADPDDPTEKNILRIASILGRLTFDARDDIIEPRRGVIADVSAEFGDSLLASEVAFIRVTYRATWILSFAERWTLVPSIRGGWAIPVEGEPEIPIQLRFFNGGENTVRSFREGRLGPRSDLGKFVGGEGFVAMTLEQRFPIWGGLGGAIFADAGHVAPKTSDYFTERLHFGVGAGLRYRTPFGPARLDAAINPAPVDAKDTWAIHFGLGYPF
ncbi:MAG: BamA/TamA family outer membrane protein [Planctomycetes bacterium]|nr:BamA/TamA family outer membrane protein [Planctomycetota bacterium]